MTEYKQDSLPEGFAIRSAGWQDIPGIVGLIRDVLIADEDEASILSSQEIETEWKTEGFNPETDTWVVIAPNGQVVGYEVFVTRHANAYFIADGYVHPQFRGRNIGAVMLGKLDQRALQQMQRAEPDLRVYIRAGTSANDANVRLMFEGAGYRVVRYQWAMMIELDRAPQIKPFPTGVELRPFNPIVQDRLIFDAQEEAFQDHWGHVPGNFHDWKLRKLGHDQFDPSLWHIAWDGDQIAGYAQTNFRNGLGWVTNLGVRRPWRKRGLGEALLLHSFNEFYQRDVKQIGLEVDASNPNGATRLYQKVGMWIDVEDIIVEKEYRPGRELAEEE